MGANQPGLIVAYVNVAFRQLCIARTQALYFPAFKHQSGLESVFDKVVVPRLAIHGDNVACWLFFGLLAAHYESVWMFKVAAIIRLCCCQVAIFV